MYFAMTYCFVFKKIMYNMILCMLMLICLSSVPQCYSDSSGVNVLCHVLGFKNSSGVNVLCHVLGFKNENIFLCNYHLLVMCIFMVVFMVNGN